MKMLSYALTSCAILTLAPTASSAADFGPPGGYVEQRPLPPPPYYAQPYYARPYYDDAYYGPHFRRPYAFYAYPYWRGPRFAYYGRPYWGGRWGGHGRRW